MIWTPFDPTWIANAVRDNYPEEKELLKNILQCTSCIVQSDSYTYFVDSTNANRPGSKWQFLRSIKINNTACGNIILDILRDKKLGGVQFLNTGLKD